MTTVRYQLDQTVTATARHPIGAGGGATRVGFAVIGTFGGGDALELYFVPEGGDAGLELGSITGNEYLSYLIPLRGEVYAELTGTGPGITANADVAVWIGT